VTELELTYGPGAAEWTGMALTALGVLLWLTAWRPSLASTVDSQGMR
jgi:hypothetical protein